MATLSITIAGDTPTGISLTSLVRTDTSAQLLVSPASMTLSGGSWIYTFTEPTAGLTYTYQYTITWSDGSTVDEAGTFEGAISVADGYYVKRAKVIHTAGQDNFDLGFNLDTSATTADETIAQAIFDQGDRFVDSRALLAGISKATASHYLDTTNAIFDAISDWASRWARAQGYLLRGVTGNEDSAKAEGQMRDMRDEAEAKIDELLKFTALNGWTFDGIKVVGPSNWNCAPCGIEVW